MAATHGGGELSASSYPTPGQRQKPNGQRQTENRQAHVNVRRDEDPLDLKKRTIYVENNNYSHHDIIKAIDNDVGQYALVGVVKTGNSWQVTLKSGVNIDDIAETGLRIKGEDVEVKLVARNLITASFFGVPSYITNDDLTAKMNDLGVIKRAPWTRKTYADYPEVESGIVFTRIELPPEVPSLPYAIKVREVYITVKHNGQIKVCNRCLSTDHLARSCPSGRKCFRCGLPGHLQRECPDEEGNNDVTLDSITDDKDDDKDDDNDDDGSDKSDNEVEEDVNDSFARPKFDWAAEDPSDDNDSDWLAEGDLLIDEDRPGQSSERRSVQVPETSSDEVRDKATSVDVTGKKPTSEESLKRSRNATTTDEDKDRMRKTPRRNKTRAARRKFPPEPEEELPLDNRYAVLRDNVEDDAG